MTATSLCSEARGRFQAEKKNNNCGYYMKTTTTGAGRRAGDQRQAIAYSENFLSLSLQSLGKKRLFAS